MIKYNYKINKLSFLISSIYCQILYVFVVLSVFDSTTSYAQDERLFRKMFSSSINQKKEKGKDISLYKLHINSKYYELDMNGDGLNDGLVFEKKDGEDWIHIYKEFFTKVKSVRLLANGIKSRIYRIKVLNISKSSRLILLYYYEGVSKYISLLGTSRIYMMTIDDRNFDTISVYRGPAIWKEYDNARGFYNQKNYKISLFDYNSDGVKELTVKYGNSAYIYRYFGNGKWKSN